MSWSECAMAFYAACQRHMMVQYWCGSGSTNKLLEKHQISLWISGCTNSVPPMIRSYVVQHCITIIIHAATTI